jgi:hypothetical protein
VGQKEEVKGEVKMEQTNIQPTPAPTLPAVGYVREAQLVTKKKKPGIIPFSPHCGAKSPAASSPSRSSFRPA